jgi:polysaccharide deacetylase 2 family uncharacterized protein YibQ
MARYKSKRKKKEKKKHYLILFLIAIVLLLVSYSLSTCEESLPEAKGDLQKVEVVKMETVRTVPESIGEAVKALNIPEKSNRIWKGSDAIYYYIGIDKNALELSYANMLFTSYIERDGGILLDGQEIDNDYRQVLTFQEPSDKQVYTIRLYYADSGIYKQKKTRLAIVIDDFGYFGGELLDKFIQLDKGLTFSILPHLAYSQEAMQKAVNAGIETMIHMPMEPLSFPTNDPGPDAIYVHYSEKEIERRVEKYISELTACKGANNHMGSLATADENVMQVVLNTLKNHNLYFVDSKTTTSSVAHDTAQKLLMKSLENDFFLDTPNLSDETMNQKIAQLKNMMKKQNSIVVITHCTNEKKYEYLAKFLAKIKPLNLEIVPVSELFEYNLPEFMIAENK